MRPIGAYRWPRGTRRLARVGSGGAAYSLVAMTRWHLIDTDAQAEERRTRIGASGEVEYVHGRRGHDGTPMRCGVRTPRTAEWLSVETRVLRTIEEFDALAPAICRGCLLFLMQELAA